MLVWCCDLIVVSEDIVFVDVVGIWLGMCGVEYFGYWWEFGLCKIKELLFIGDCIGVDEVYVLGMVSKVFFVDEFVISIIEFVCWIVKVLMMVVLLIKELVN